LATCGALTHDRHQARFFDRGAGQGGFRTYPAPEAATPAPREYAQLDDLTPTKAASHEKDVQQLVAEGLNFVFKKCGLPNRVPVHSGRRTPQKRAAS